MKTLGAYTCQYCGELVPVINPHVCEEMRNSPLCFDKPLSEEEIRFLFENPQSIEILKNGMTNESNRN